MGDLKVPKEKYIKTKKHKENIREAIKEWHKKIGHSKKVKIKIRDSLKGRFKGEDSPHWNYNKPRCIQCNNILANHYAKICGKCRAKDYRCIDCGAKTRKGVKRCQHCFLKILHNLNRTGSNSKINRKKGICIDCNKIITTGAKRCHLCYSKSISGKNSPLYKNKEEIYCIDCGKKICHSAKRCVKCFLKKENNPLYGKKSEKSYRWKGGTSTLYSMIRHLQESKNWRSRVFKRDNYTCQECFKRGVNLEAHHKNPFALIFQEFLQEYNQFSPIEDKETLVRLTMKYEPFWDINNGKTLCNHCHNLTKRRADLITKKENSRGLSDMQ